MRCVEPDGGEERLAGTGRVADEIEGVIHDEGGVAAEHGFAHGQAVDVIRCRIGLVGPGETVAVEAAARIPERHGVLGRDATLIAARPGRRKAIDDPVVQLRRQMIDVMLAVGYPGVLEGARVPFAEVAGAIADRAESRGQGLLLLGQMALADMVDAVAEVVPPGQAGAAGRRADRAAGLEAGQPRARGAEAIEMRRPDHAIAVETGVAVTEIVAHDENDVRRFGAHDPA